MQVGARDLIRKMLITDPERRPSASDCLKHVWMEEVQLKREHALNDKRRAFLVVRRTACARTRRTSILPVVLICV